MADGEGGDGRADVRTMLEPMRNLLDETRNECCLCMEGRTPETYCTITTIDHTARVPLRPKLLNRI